MTCALFVTFTGFSPIQLRFGLLFVWVLFLHPRNRELRKWCGQSVQIHTHTHTNNNDSRFTALWNFYVITFTNWTGRKGSSIGSAPFELHHPLMLFVVTSRFRSDKSPKQMRTHQENKAKHNINIRASSNIYIRFGKIFNDANRWLRVFFSPKQLTTDFDPNWFSALLFLYE